MMEAAVQGALSEALDLLPGFENATDGRISPTLFNQQGTISDTGVRLFFENMRKDFVQGIADQVKDWMVEEVFARIP